MKIKVAWIGKTKEPAIEALTDEYLKRLSRFADVTGFAVKDEAAILSLASGDRSQSRKSNNKNNNNKERLKLVLLDARGKQLSSEELAELLEREQVNAIPLLFAVGGSDGADGLQRLHLEPARQAPSGTLELIAPQLAMAS